MHCAPVWQSGTGTDAQFIPARNIAPVCTVVQMCIIAPLHIVYLCHMHRCTGAHHCTGAHPCAGPNCGAILIRSVATHRCASGHFPSQHLCTSLHELRSLPRAHRRAGDRLCPSPRHFTGAHRGTGGHGCAGIYPCIIAHRSSLHWSHHCLPPINVHCALLQWAASLLWRPSLPRPPSWGQLPSLHSGRSLAWRPSLHKRLSFHQLPSLLKRPSLYQHP